MDHRDKVTWVNLYKVYVRSTLECSVQAWSPWTQEDIDILESVQKRAIRMVSGLQGRTYEERLFELGLTSLEDRRKRGDMIEVWKILHGEEDVDASTWFTLASKATDRKTRNTSDLLNLSQPKWSHQFRKNFFSVRVVEQWNSLPSGLKSSTNLNMFKNNYDSLLNTNNS